MGLKAKYNPKGRERVLLRSRRQTKISFEPARLPDIYSRHRTSCYYLGDSSDYCWSRKLNKEEGSIPARLEKMYISLEQDRGNIAKATRCEPRIESVRVVDC